MDSQRPDATKEMSDNPRLSDIGDNQNRSSLVDYSENVPDWPLHRTMLSAISDTTRSTDSKMRHAMPDESDAGEDRSAAKQAFPNLSSLPVAEAFPETTQAGTVMVFTTAVEYIKDDNLGDRPSLISFQLFKETVDQELGMEFRSTNGELLFSGIFPWSPLAKSSIRVGDRLTSVDDHQSVTHWSVVQIANHLRSRDGYVSIVVETKNGDTNIVEACVYKATAESKLGISFQNDQQGQLRILNVTGDGLLGETSVLRADDYVESINGIPAQSMDAASADEFVTSLVGMVSVRTKKANTTKVSMHNVMTAGQMSNEIRHDNVVAADELDVMESGDFLPDDDRVLPRPRFISVTVHKPTIETRLGISFRNPTGDALIISNIGDQSLLSKTPLKAGCIVYSINGIPTLLYTGSQALDVIKGLSGTIRVCAEDRTGDVSHAMAMVFKPTPRAPLGLTFRLRGGRLSLHRITSDGLFANSVLNEGDQVISINKIRCDHIPAAEAIEITQRNPKSVTVLVRLSPNNVIVVSHRKAHQGEVTCMEHAVFEINDRQDGDNDEDGCCTGYALAIGAGVCISAVFTATLIAASYFF